MMKLVSRMIDLWLMDRAMHVIGLSLLIASIGLFIFQPTPGGLKDGYTTDYMALGYAAGGFAALWLRETQMSFSNRASS